MEILIHQALYGELNKAWNLLETTFPDIDLAKTISFKTDLQDNPLSGVAWSPAVRGFLFNEHYLLIKTFLDTSPEVRTGRVFSHCLIINRTDLDKINNLSELFCYFPEELNKALVLEPIKLKLKTNKNTFNEESYRLRFNKVIQSFVKLSGSKGTIIWVGQEDYEVSVTNLWQLLSQAQKENFNFGINFNPSEIPKDKLNFIVIPENITNKFESQEFHIIRKNDFVELKEFQEQYLAGEQNAVDKLDKFINAIGAEKPTLREIPLIAKGISTFEKIDKVTDIKLLITLSNIISKFSPDNNKGELIKSKIIFKVSELCEIANENDIMLLRNFPLNSFKNSKNIILKSIQQWTENKLFSMESNLTKDYSQFLNQIYDIPDSNWLIDSVKSLINDFLSKVDSSKAKIVWNWLTSNVNLIHFMSNKISNSKTTESYFIDMNQPKDNSIEAIKKFTLNKEWLRVYASIIKSQYNISTALTEQLKVDTNPNYSEAIEILLKDQKPKDILNQTILNGDIRCISISGKHCKMDPILLNGIDVTQMNWQKIWLKAIENGNNLIDGIKNPKQIIWKLFDELILSKKIEEGLLRKISESEYANIIDYHDRNNLWSKIPANLKSNFLEKTSADMLEKLSKDSTYQIPTDLELSNYIISNGISTFLYYNSNNIKTVLPIFNSFEHIPEHVLRGYLNNYSGKLDVVDATQLGKLIKSRNYTEVAHLINDRFYTNKNYKYTLAECNELLSFITRGMIAISNKISNITINVDEWWDAFSDLTIRLYNSGPTENKIWNQADGKDYDLLIKGTGKETWLAALQKLKNGGCEGITVKKLLKSMLKEFPNNEELKTLKELWKKL